MSRPQYVGHHFNQAPRAVTIFVKATQSRLNWSLYIGVAVQLFRLKLCCVDWLIWRNVIFYSNKRKIFETCKKVLKANVNELMNTLQLSGDGTMAGNLRRDFNVCNANPSIFEAVSYIIKSMWALLLTKKIESKKQEGGEIEKSSYLFFRFRTCPRVWRVWTAFRTKIKRSFTHPFQIWGQQQQQPTFLYVRG